jgi:hypothetical protein
MLFPIQQLPDSARLWIYQAARNLTPAEARTAETHLRAFCTSWAAHGQPLRGGFALLEGRFVALAVDEDAALPSGCSIDSSVAALRALSVALDGLDFLDKSHIPYQAADGTVATFARGDLREAVANGSLTPDTRVFDTLVPTLGALRAGWRKTAAQTWLARYFATEKMAI